MHLLMVAGFLGSGKTTLLNQLAAAAARRGQRPAILENEAGKVGIDDQFLAQSGCRVISMLGGCACCDLQARLVDVLGNLARENERDLVFFEPSGVASIDSLLAALARYAPAGLSMGLICLLDASRFQIMQKGLGKLLLSQLNLAGQVVISKPDLVEVSELAAIRERARELAPLAQVREANLLGSGLEALADSLLELTPAVPRLFLPAVGSPLKYQAWRSELTPPPGAGPERLLDLVRSVLRELGAAQGEFLGHVKILARDGDGRPLLASGTGEADVSLRGTAKGPLAGPAELAIIQAGGDGREWEPPSGVGHVLADWGVGRKPEIILS